MRIFRKKSIIALLIAALALACVCACGADMKDNAELRQKDVTTIEELYAKNKEAEAEFHALMTSLSDEFGAELLERKQPKSEKRVREKVEKNYDGDYSRVTDILAATLVFDTEEKILAAAEALKSRKYIVQFTDRWTVIKGSGYRDFQFKIALSNGVIAELQLHHRKIAEVNSYLAHSLYEFVRSNEGREGTASGLAVLALMLRRSRV
ncbi:MAG: hypothetical protein K5841_08760 [Fretibacterium sp.]|nr:hypothetical protein [Fretibacterium sp.]